MWNLLKNCTDEIQPIDAGYGQIVRRLVGEAFLRWLDSPDVDPHSNKLNVEMWETPGMLPAYKRRVLMTEWVAEAVAEANADDGKLFSTFVQTGCLLAADGHTDKDIKLEGYDGRIDYQNFVLPERTTTEAASDSIAVQAVAAANALSEDAIMNLKVTELKLHLKALQQAQTGLKTVLQARLKAAVAGTAGAMDTSAAAEPSAEAAELPEVEDLDENGDVFDLFELMVSDGEDDS